MINVFLVIFTSFRVIMLKLNPLILRRKQNKSFLKNISGFVCFFLFLILMAFTTIFFV